MFRSRLGGGGLRDVLAPGRSARRRGEGRGESGRLRVSARCALTVREPEARRRRECVGCATFRNFCVRNFLSYSIIPSPIMLKLGQDVPHTIEN